MSLKLTQKGRGVLDPHLSSNLEKGIILDEKGILYSCTLNQTDIKNNNNKFYIMQLISTANGFTVFKRWGRVGVKGQIKELDFSSKSNAIYEFENTFNSKTKNDWETSYKNPDNFKKYSGKYYMCEIDYGNNSKDDTNKSDSKLDNDGKITFKPSDVKSKLAKATFHLMELFTNRDTMLETMKELEIDVKKMPLGKISKKQIKKAYDILIDLQKDITDNKLTTDKALDESSMFYTLIPMDFGRNKPPAISNSDSVDKMKNVLEVLGDIEVANTVLSNNLDNEKKHPLDMVYSSMDCKIKLLPKKNVIYKEILKFIYNTHCPTHRDYDPKITNIFQIARKGEREKYLKSWEKVNNKRLLWHGTRMTNFVSLLTTGFKLNPNAPICGKLFGQGIYLSSSVSKSIQYCRPKLSNGKICMLLCEVALGKMRKLGNPTKVMDVPNKKDQSVWGVGKKTNEPGDVYIGDDDVEIHYGKIVKNENRDIETMLRYDEYVIYSEDQLNIRYIVEMDVSY